MGRWSGPLAPVGLEVRPREGCPSYLGASAFLSAKWEGWTGPFLSNTLEIDGWRRTCLDMGPVEETKNNVPL